MRYGPIDVPGLMAIAVRIIRGAKEDFRSTRPEIDAPVHQFLPARPAHQANPFAQKKSVGFRSAGEVLFKNRVNERVPPFSAQAYIFSVATLASHADLLKHTS